LEYVGQELETYIMTSNSQEILREEVPKRMDTYLKSFHYFVQLPTLVKETIFSFLDMRSLKLCLFVCKQWAILVNSFSREKALMVWAISKEVAKSSWIGPTNWYIIYRKVRNMWSHKGADVVIRWLNAYTAEYIEVKKIDFKKFYQDVFYAVRERNPSTRIFQTVRIGIAIQLWSLLMQDRCCFLDMWIAFLLQTGALKVSADTWNMFYAFSESFTNDTFSNYDLDGCWPILIDDFVTYVQQHTKISNQII